METPIETYIDIMGIQVVSGQAGGGSFKTETPSIWNKNEE